MIDAERPRRVETILNQNTSPEDAETVESSDAIDSIALEAIGQAPTSTDHPGAHLEGMAGEPSTEGQRIDEYCDSRRLDVPARLKLFCQVCRAIHVAHQHAVIHQDLKPGNILVTSEGVPKVIGSGIPKLILAEQFATTDAESEEPATLTRTGESELTPEFASPEQVKGETVTTASDIYALGVILYMLLTGRRPYWLKTDSSAEVLQAICEQVPEKPSKSVVRAESSQVSSSDPVRATVILPLASSADSPSLPQATGLHVTSDLIAAARGYSPARLKRILSGDLDAIILMAMRKEPERRYASAEQFAEDLERHLQGLPVRAHRDSVIYRVTKFAPEFRGSDRGCDFSLGTSCRHPRKRDGIDHGPS